MASPTVEATATSALETAGTSHTVSLPTGIVSGSGLIAIFGYTSALPIAVTWPAGWTPITNFKTEQSTVVGFDAAYRQADGTEGASITVTTDGSTKSQHESYRIAGHESFATRSPESTTGASGDSSVQPNPPDLTPTGGSKDYLWLAAACSDGENSITAYPLNYTNGITSNSGLGGPTSTNCYGGSAQRALTAASENPGTFTTGANNWVAQTVAIHPAGAGAQSIAVVKASETETAKTVTAAPGVVSIAVATASETETAVAVAATATISVAVGVATETETVDNGGSFGVMPVAGPVSVTVGAATETETAQTVTAVPGAVTVTVGVATETETAQIVDPVSEGGPQSITVGTASETETANAVTVLAVVTVSVGVAAETETAPGVVAVPGAVSIAVGTATETETAQPVTVSQTGVTFWTSNPAAYTANPAAYTPVRAGDTPPPW